MNCRGWILLEVAAAIAVAGFVGQLVLQATTVSFNPSDFIGAGIVVVLLLLVMKNQREDAKQFLERFARLEAALAATPGLMDGKVTESRHLLRNEFHAAQMRAEERHQEVHDLLHHRLNRLEGRDI